MQSETQFIARYAETDQMGIVHHSNYPIWFEAGRTDFLKKSGMANSKIEELGILLPLSHIDCAFKSPARYEGEIMVKTPLWEMSRARIEFEYEIVKDKGGAPTAIGGASHARADKSLKPLNIEKKLPERWCILKKAMG
ncbi:acyl-CoA thioesterase [Acetivibrio cellulolyticus]|uniref:acyl-CoA thioesterase n=1 Tax=Acetivibrio cellulolyticus TaxID=35830 RepID=UPI000474DFF0|nr:thioesterase family protein [Acetivibrio cellulolyticus]